jgi:hypothetical protein
MAPLTLPLRAPSTHTQPLPHSPSTHTAMGNVPSGALAKAAPIHEAAAMDNVGKLRALLAEGEDVNAVDKVRAERGRGRGGERGNPAFCGGSLGDALHTGLRGW